jgi:hypothetical protein
LIAEHAPTLRSPDPKVICPIFREYCVDSYFVWDHQSVGFAADVFARFGNRAIEESVAPARSMVAPIEGTLKHLACHYHRIWLEPGVTQIQVRLDTASPWIVADLVLVDRSLRSEQRRRVAPVATLQDLRLENEDHAIVVVTNTSIVGDFPLNSRYKLTVAAAQ